jgi:hypothetical protein
MVTRWVPLVVQKPLTLNSYATVYQIKKEKPNWNQVSPIKIEGQTLQWAKKNGQTSIDKRINRKK